MKKPGLCEKKEMNNEKPRIMTSTDETSLKNSVDALCAPVEESSQGLLRCYRQKCARDNKKRRGDSNQTSNEKSSIGTWLAIFAKQLPCSQIFSVLNSSFKVRDWLYIKDECMSDNEDPPNVGSKQLGSSCKGQRTNVAQTYIQRQSCRRNISQIPVIVPHNTIALDKTCHINSITIVVDLGAAN